MERKDDFTKEQMERQAIDGTASWLRESWYRRFRIIWGLMFKGFPPKVEKPKREHFIPLAGLILYAWESEGDWGIVGIVLLHSAYCYGVSVGIGALAAAII